MRTWIFLLLLSVGVLGGCRAKLQPVVSTDVASPHVQSQALRQAENAAQGEPLFRQLAPEATGIDLVHQFPDDAGGDMLSDQNSGSGLCIGDVDGDGLPDVFLTNYNQGNRLYRNRGGMRFDDVTAEAGVGGEGRWCAGPTFVDIDNDGDLDLHVSVYAGKNLLYVNDGQGRFTERAAEFGLDVNAASVMMAFADYDCDGDLDAYLVTHRLVTEGKKHVLPENSQAAKQRGVVEVDRQRGVRVTPEYEDYFGVMSKGKSDRIALVIAGQEDYLFRNERGKFRAVQAAAGIQGHDIGLSAIWWDYNNDLRPDLYVSNDYKGADKLYRNNGDGTFTDVVSELCPHIPWYSMGADVGDVNNDGWVDLFASDMAGTTHYKQKMAMGDMSDDAWFLDLARPPQYMRNAMFLNTGGGRMLEVAKLAGIASSDWTWSPKLGDLDNDGWLDLFIANGMSRDYMNSDRYQNSRRGDAAWKDDPVLREQNLAFRNRDGWRFDDVSQDWGVDHLSASYGAAFSDLDRDGDLDLVVTNFGEAVSVYENRSVAPRLLMRLVGTSSNRAGLGARVELTTSAGKQTRQLNSAQGFMSSNEALVHFGVGDAEVEQAVVYWPSGIVQTLDASQLPANHLVVVEESPSGGAGETVASLTSVFSATDVLDEYRHQEQPFDDFATQPLLPAKKSQLGPGIACGDINQDGFDDYYLGAAAGAVGRLVLGNGGGVIELPPDDAGYEDMGALLLDADSDGDLDLYVVSGGVEAEADSEVLQDRLYLRAGDGYEWAADRLPELRDAGSCVSAADFDRDGDLDLFVGGYCVPGRYPESASSRLLRNDSGKFVDVTHEMAPQLANLRLVTSAIWSDVDGDRWLDLLVTQEWGTIAVFFNQDGQLEESSSTGVESLRGWWGGIAGGDVDGDGDMDFVVGNQGTNTKYHADDEHPSRLYCGDFDGSGKQHLVEAKYEGGILLPERGKSCSTAAIPILAERFSTYQAFATAGLEEIYTPQSLNSAEHLSVNTLESGVLLNDGRGQFRFQPLPTAAQLAPIDGVTLSHFDADGVLDLVVAQNDFSPQRETGRMDGGVSLLLRGQGDGSFVAEWPLVSGISVDGDAQCVLATDLNQDQCADLVFGVNDQAWRGFVSQKGTRLAVVLRGPAGNVTGVGARVVVETKQGRKLVQEVYAGAGYLTQSSPTLFFGVEPGQVDTVRVHWADGKTTTVGTIEGQTVVNWRF